MAGKSKLLQRITAPYAIYLVLKDPDVPRDAKVKAALLMAMVFAYVISPFNLIPDLIPFAGWIDDIVVAGLFMSVAERVVPQVGMRAKQELAKSQVRKVAGRVAIVLLVIIVVGLPVLAGLIYLIVRLVTH